MKNRTPAIRWFLRRFAVLSQDEVAELTGLTREQVAEAEESGLSKILEQLAPIAPELHEALMAHWKACDSPQLPIYETPVKLDDNELP